MKLKTENTKVGAVPSGSIVSQKIRDYAQLLKVRLALLVVFSAAAGFALASSGAIDWIGLLTLCIGGFLLTGASTALNQAIEKDYDRLMDRTKNRPIPSGRMNISEAILIAGLMSVVGILLLATFNPLTALVGMVSLLSYAFVYTPMKRISSLAVVVGALPGGLPPLIGWVAVTGSLGPEALAIFGIQFIWQFPHFWSIAWLAHDDYAKAGYFLLPSKGGRNKASALQSLIYASLLIPLGFFLYWLGVTGLVSAIIASFAGLAFTGLAVNLYRKCDNRAARMLMFGSFFYLPVVLISLMVDKL